LIERLSREDFKPEQFKDEYRLRVLAAIDEKRKGEEITIAPEPERRRPTPTIDLLEALKRSMEGMPKQQRARRKPATARKKRKRPSY
jgi:DNA end-binding protein Ku